ncbi:MAG: hypothetical protein AAF125_11100, partial [Chloroflexota bacterium]
TMALWLLFALSISFPFKKLTGQKAWRWLHLTSYLAFGMVSVHAIAAGTDAEQIGFRVMVGTGVAAVVLLLGMRLGRAGTTVKPTRQRTA